MGYDIIPHSKMLATNLQYIRPLCYQLIIDPQNGTAVYALYLSLVRSSPPGSERRSCSCDVEMCQESEGEYEGAFPTVAT